MHTVTMILDKTSLAHLTADQLRELVLQQHQEKQALQELNNSLKIEIALLRRLRYSHSSEQLHGGQQGLLFGEAIDEDIAAVEMLVEQSVESGMVKPSATPTLKRVQVPDTYLDKLPQVTIRHDPTSSQCACGCQLTRIGEETSRKLDYQPGRFTVENHIRSKWACRQCERIVQEPMPAQVIDKGLASAGLLAHVLVYKYVDHLPLYRQESIFARSGYRLARSTLAQWVGACGVHLQPLVDALRQHVLGQAVLQADETPVRMLEPGKGKTHQAYLWAYTPGPFSPLKAVVYEFTPGRSGQHARQFLGNWQGKLVCDDYAGYKALFQEGHILEAGCWAHARRKFFDVFQANQSDVAQQALQFIQQLYEIERELQDLTLEERYQQRQAQMRPRLEKWRVWLEEYTQLVPPKSAILKAMMYSLTRWTALTRFLDDPHLPIDNNAAENLMRPIAVGRKNWLFAGSLRAGQRAAAIMSLVQSAKLNGHDPHAYLTDILTRLPTHKAKDIEELLPHQWKPT